MKFKVLKEIKISSTVVKPGSIISVNESQSRDVLTKKEQESVDIVKRDLTLDPRRKHPFTLMDLATSIYGITEYSDELLSRMTYILSKCYNGIDNTWDSLILN